MSAVPEKINRSQKEDLYPSGKTGIFSSPEISNKDNEQAEGENKKIWEKVSGLSGEELLNSVWDLKENKTLKKLTFNQQKKLIKRCVDQYRELYTENKYTPFYNDRDFEVEYEDVPQFVSLVSPSAKQEADFSNAYLDILPDLLVDSKNNSNFREVVLEPINYQLTDDLSVKFWEGNHFLQALQSLYENNEQELAIDLGSISLKDFGGPNLLSAIEKRLKKMNTEDADSAMGFLSFLEDVEETAYLPEFTTGDNRAWISTLRESLRKIRGQIKSSLVRRKADAIFDRQKSYNNFYEAWSSDKQRKFLTEQEQDRGDWWKEKIKVSSDKDLPKLFAQLDLYGELYRDEMLKFEERNGMRTKDPKSVEIEIKGIPKGEFYEVIPLSTDAYVVYDIFGRPKGLLDRDIISNSVDSSEIKSFVLDKQNKQSVSTTWEEQITRTKEATHHYEMLLDKGIIDGIEQDYEFPVRELTTREQLWFMSSLRDYSVEDEKQVINFTKQYGLDGARAFLSVEHGDEFRDIVLELGKKLDPKVAKQVFKRYGDISRIAQENIDEEMTRFFKTGHKQQTGAAEKVEQEMLSRAKLLLEQAAAGEGNSEKILETLDRYATDATTFASIFKATMKNNEEIGFDNLQNISFGSFSPAELSEKDRAQMLAISRANFDQDRPDIMEYVFEGLRDKLKSSNTESRFTLLKKQKEIVGFIRFDTRQDGDLYAGSLNVRPDMRGSALGEALMRETLDVEAKKHVIHAVAVADNPATVAYVERFGFVIVGTDVETAPDGNTFDVMVIERNDNLSKKLFSRSAEFDTPEKLQTAGFRVETYDISTPEGTDMFYKAFTDAKTRGEIATRLIKGEQKGQRYVVFESLPVSLEAAA